MKTIEWIPASKPPKHLEVVLITGGNYVVSQGIYTPNALSNSPAGFYLQAGESLFAAPWVEWWIPMPVKPSKS